MIVSTQRKLGETVTITLVSFKETGRDRMATSSGTYWRLYSVCLSYSCTAIWSTPVLSTCCLCTHSFYFSWSNSSDPNLCYGIHQVNFNRPSWILWKGCFFLKQMIHSSLHCSLTTADENCVRGLGTRLLLSHKVFITSWSPKHFSQ